MINQNEMLHLSVNSRVHSIEKVSWAATFAEKHFSFSDEFLNVCLQTKIFRERFTSMDVLTTSPCLLDALAYGKNFFLFCREVHMKRTHQKLLY